MIMKWAYFPTNQTKRIEKEAVVGNMHHAVSYARSLSNDFGDRLIYVDVVIRILDDKSFS